ncbi:MAG: PEP-CTERM sorting domain-containing protein [Akkermansiaceae bacterium]|jgi:hypothetical protein|nr:PEP-CTERM sorting domain-containing protein [Akkermansiaceae bacterium]
MKTPARILRIACLLAAGSAAHGAALLTSFESAGELFPTTATNTPISQSTLYATDGTYSMAMGVASGNWNWSSKTYGSTAYADWKANNTMTIDLTRVTGANGANLEFVIAINGPQGWNQVQLVNWAWQNENLTSSQTLEWDYSAIAAAAPASGTWWQLNILARSGQLNQTVYLDNIQFIPEPGAAALLGLAGLGLLARRRR